MRPLLGSSSLQCEDLVVGGGPRGGPLCLQQGGRAAVPRLHLPLHTVPCSSTGDSEGSTLVCRSSQPPQTARIQFNGAACGAHRQPQPGWAHETPTPTPESVLHLCTYRGGPRSGPLQAEGLEDPKGSCQGPPPSAKPPNLLHAFAETKGLNRLGGGDCPYSSQKKRQIEDGTHAIKTLGAPEGMGTELRGRGGSPPAATGDSRGPRAASQASQRAGAQQQKQQLPVAARLRLDLGSVSGAFDTSPRTQVRLGAPLGAPASPYRAPHMPQMQGPDSTAAAGRAAEAKGYSVRLQQHNEWHAERLSPMQQQLRRQQLQQQQQQRRGHLTARASTMGAPPSWLSSCSSHLQGVLFCEETPRAPRSHVQNLVQQLEARRLRCKGGGALKAMGSPSGCRAHERAALRFKESFERDSPSRGAASDKPNSNTDAERPVAPKEENPRRREAAKPAETPKPAAAACAPASASVRAGEGPAEVLEEKWGTGAPPGGPVGGPPGTPPTRGAPGGHLLQAALARGPPEKVVGSYLLGRTIGEGTFGKVRVATHALTGECVAVKVLEKEKLKAAEDAERVLREIHILRAVRHPHIIHLLEILETPSRLYLVMELASGGELFDFIVQRQRVDEGTARRLFRQILSGVEALHSLCICHRDLKPENLLLDASMNIKIVDFGLSNIYSHKPMLKTACGSPSYAAPEIVQGKLYSPLAVDIWSCGVILYALLVGRLPFEENTTEGLYRSIVSGQFGCPKYLSAEASSLLKGILHTCPLKRLGPLQIKQHPWLREGRGIQHIPLSLSSSRWPSGPPVCSLKDCRACAEWLSPPSAQLRRDILEQMPPCNYSLEALECHIRCHPVGAHAATYYLLCLKKRREEEEAAAAAAAKQQRSSPSLPPCGGPSPASTRLKCPKDSSASVAEKSETPTTTPSLAAESQTAKAEGPRRPAPKSGAPREAPKGAPGLPGGPTVQKRLKGSCSSETSLQQRLQQQRQQHQLQLTEKLLQPLVGRSARAQAAPNTRSSSRSSSSSSPIASAETSRQTPSIQLPRLSSDSERPPRAAQQRGASVGGPTEKSASGGFFRSPDTPQPPQEGPPLPLQRSDRRTCEKETQAKETVGSPSRNSVVQRPTTSWDNRSGTLQQKGKDTPLKQKRLESSLQQHQQKQQQQVQHEGQHDEKLPVLEKPQPAQQQQTNCEALQLTQLMMRDMVVRQQLQLRGESLQQSVGLEGGPSRDEYTLRGLLTAREPLPPSAQLNCNLGAPKSPRRVLQSLLSPRCLLTAADLSCEGTTQQQQQQQQHEGCAVAPAESGLSTHQAQRCVSAHAETPQIQHRSPPASASSVAVALAQLPLAAAKPRRSLQLNSKGGSEDGAVSVPSRLSSSVTQHIPKAPSRSEQGGKRMQEEEKQTQKSADKTTVASAAQSPKDAATRSPTNLKKISSNNSRSSSSNSTWAGTSVAASATGACIRNRKPSGLSASLSVQKQQRQTPLQRAQQQPLQHSSTWQAKRGSIRAEQQRLSLAAAALGRSATTTETPRASLRVETPAGAPAGAPTGVLTGPHVAAKPQGKAVGLKGPLRRVAPLRLSLSTGCAPSSSTVAAAPAAAAPSSSVVRGPVGVNLDGSLRKGSLARLPPPRGSLTARVTLRRSIAAGGKAAAAPPPAAAAATPAAGAAGAAGAAVNRVTRRLGSSALEASVKTQDMRARERPSATVVRASSTACSSSSASHPPLSAKRPQTDTFKLAPLPHATATGTSRAPLRAGGGAAGALAAAAKAAATAAAAARGAALQTSRHRSLTAEGLPTDRPRAPANPCGVTTAAVTAQKASKGPPPDSRMQKTPRTATTSTSLLRRSAAVGGLSHAASASVSGPAHGLRPAAVAATAAAAAAAAAIAAATPAATTTAASSKTGDGRSKVGPGTKTASTHRSSSGAPGISTAGKVPLGSRGGLHPASLLSARASGQVLPSNRKQQLLLQQQQQQQPKRGSLLRCKTAGAAEENRKGNQKNLQGLPNNRCSLPQGNF